MAAIPEPATDPVIRARGVDFVLVPVKDMARARAFYRDVLGLQPSSLWQRDEDADQPIGAEFETGDVTLALFDVAKAGREWSGGAGAIALRVDDVPTARERVEAHGIAFAMDTIDSGVCHQAILQDSEGNALILHHRYAPRADRP